jgi:hypothetical protein
MPNCRGFCGCVQHCQVPEFGRITQKVDFYRLLQQRAERGNDSEKFCFLFFSSMNIWKLEFSHTCILTLHLSSLNFDQSWQHALATLVPTPTLFTLLSLHY